MARIELPVAEIVERYGTGESTRALGLAYGVGCWTIQDRLHTAGVELRPRGGPFGNTYALGHHRPGGPLSFDGDGYLRTYDRDGKSGSVHRGCWEAYHGPIPCGHVVHHRDGDREHNDIENLACMPRGEHVAIHNVGRPPRA